MPPDAESLTAETEPSGKWKVLGLLAVAELLAMSLWFSASAVTQSLTEQWNLSAPTAAWLTMAVQLGFVVGALLSALFNISDLWEPKKVFAAGALGAAALNAAIPLFAEGVGLALFLRFWTGFALAAVYPVGMKIVATWTKKDRGLALGLLVGALAIGSASPHLVRSIGKLADWKHVMFTVSWLACAGGILVLIGGNSGPFGLPKTKFRFAYILRAISDRPLRLANIGYLGHMWELFAMWTWIPIFLTAAYTSSSNHPWFSEMGYDPDRLGSLVAFFVIAMGGAGSLVAGRMADRVGRSLTTIYSMAISGVCALTIGLLWRHPVALTIVALIWGASVLADSAQFSSAVSELAETEYMGTMLTAQTSMGFLLTLITIRLLPNAVEMVSWRWAFAFLAIGPAVGCWAMWALKSSPDAARMAGGKG